MQLAAALARAYVINMESSADHRYLRVSDDYRKASANGGRR
jgi:hypothetical protein